MKGKTRVVVLPREACTDIPGFRTITDNIQKLPETVLP